jgi:hypothetical protein
MGSNHVVGLLRPYTPVRARSAHAPGRRSLTVVAVVAVLIATTLTLAAGPARAGAAPAGVAAAAVSPDTDTRTALETATELADGLPAGWQAPARATTGFGSPSAQEDDVVIYNRANLYWEIHISLTGKATPYQIGQEYARAMTQADWWWWKKVYVYLLAAPAFTHVSYGDMVARANAIKQTVPSDVRGYVEGMASVISKKSLGLVNENDCWVLNLYPDVARPSMCSALGAWGHYTEGGRPILGRDLDWSDDPILPTLNAVTVYHNGAKSFCSLGYLGLWQVISGFNKSGLYGGILDAATGQPYPKITDQHSYPTDLRTALETTSTIKDAAAVLQKNNYAFDHQIVLADKTRVGILENDMLSKGPWARKVRVDSTPLNDGITWGFKDAVCAVNSFLSKGNDSGAFKQTWNANRWKAYTAQMKMVGSMTVAKMKDIISYGSPDAEAMPYNFQTTMMMVYQPTTRHLELFMKPRSGGLPKKPSWQSIDIDFGATMFGGRWVREWQPEGWSIEDATVQPADGGGVYAAAQLTRDNGAEHAVAVVRYRADGRRAWARIIDPAGADDAQLAGLAVTPDGVVVGATRNASDGAAWLVTAYTAAGRRSWQAADAVVTGHIDQLGGIAADPAGNVYAGGGVTQSSAVVAPGTQPATDWRLCKYGPRGRRQWTRTVASDQGLSERITAVAGLGRTVCVAGSWTQDASGGQLAVARVAADGTVRWFTPWTTDRMISPEATGLAATAAGVAVGGRDSMAAAGAGPTGRALSGRCALRLDPTAGTVEWASTSLPAAGESATAYNDVAIDSYGNVSAAGETSAAGASAGVVTWFDDDGTPLDASFGEGGAVNEASAVAAGPRGVTYVTGAVSTVDDAPVMSTTCLDMGGQPRWVITYEGNADANVACRGYELALRGCKAFVVGSAGDALVTAKYDVSTTPLSDALMK